MIVVPVFITSCHVSEKLKNGPDTAQTITIAAAVRKAKELPVHDVMVVAILSKKPWLSDFVIL